MLRLNGLLLGSTLLLSTPFCKGLLDCCVIAFVRGVDRWFEIAFIDIVPPWVDFADERYSSQGCLQCNLGYLFFATTPSMSDEVEQPEAILCLRLRIDLVGKPGGLW